MKAVARILIYEFRRQGRRRAYLFFTIGIPLIAIVLFQAWQLYQALAPSSSKDTVNALFSSKNPSTDMFRAIGVVDRSGLLAGSPPLLSNLIKYDSEDQAKSALRDGKIASYYVLASDYIQSGHVDMVFDRFSLTNLDTPTLNDWIVNSLLARIGKGDQRDLVKRLEIPPTYVPHNVNDSGGVQNGNSNGASLALSYVVSYALMFSAFLTSGYLMASIVEEKESRMIEILLSSVRPIQLLAGKLLALSLLGLIQMACWGLALAYLLRQAIAFSTGTLGLQLPSASQIGVMILYFLLGYLLLAAFYASIGALVTNMREGPQLATFITLPFIAPLYTLQIISSAPNGQLAVSMSIFPITAPMTMIIRAALTDVPPGEIALSAGLLTLTILFALWLAGRIFRVSTLLSGQLPKLRDLPRLLRETLMSA